MWPEDGKGRKERKKELNRKKKMKRIFLDKELELC
jgi:hypothetical protein